MSHHAREHTHTYTHTHTDARTHARTHARTSTFYGLQFTRFTAAKHTDLVYLTVRFVHA